MPKMTPPLSEQPDQPHTEAVSSDLSYFTVLDAVSTPILLHRLGRVIYINEAMARLTGYSREEVYGWWFYEIGHGKWKETLFERAEARMRGEQVPNVYEFPLQTKDDRECWVELTASRLNLGDIPTIFCSIYDLTDRKKIEVAQIQMQKMLAQIIDGSPVPTFVINAEHKVTHWNQACAALTGIAAENMLGSSDIWELFYSTPRPVLAELIVDNSIDSLDSYYAHKLKPSVLVEGGYEVEDFFPQLGQEGRWLYFTAAPLRDVSGQLIGAVETLLDITDHRSAEQKLLKYQTELEELVEQRTGELGEANRKLESDVQRRALIEAELTKRNGELTELNAKLADATKQLVQSEKLASIGQLAAGVAHEINNPIGYVHSNIGTLDVYLTDLFSVLNAYEKLEPGLGQPEQNSLQALRKDVDIDFLKEDIPVLMRESKEGITRVRKIVQDLKDFSRVDSTQEWSWVNLHHGLDSTINIVANEIKYKADIVKEYGELPEVQCLSSQLNQVFMNLLVNAAHAMGEQRGRITIRTGASQDHVWLSFEDTGSGMSDEIRQKIFDPFFTTKPIGQGTGLGLSLSYGIVQNHNGQIEVESTPGKGTTFRITLPIKHQEQEAT